MLSGSQIRNILQNKKYCANGFYKNEFREFEGNIELDYGGFISFEQVEERIRHEENYLDPLFHILEIEKDENEGYYCNMVFFNKCDSEGYLDGFDINGFNKYGYDKKGNNRKGFNKYGYKECNGYIILENGEKISFKDVEKRLQDPDGYYFDPLHHISSEKLNYLENIRFFKRCDKDGFDKNGLDEYGFDKNGFDKDGYDRDGYDYNGYDCNDYDCNGYDRDGYDINGYDIYGYNEEGYDCDGNYYIGGNDDEEGNVEEEDNSTRLTSSAA